MVKQRIKNKHVYSKEAMTEKIEELRYDVNMLDDKLMNLEDSVNSLKVKYLRLLDDIEYIAKIQKDNIEDNMIDRVFSLVHIGLDLFLIYLLAKWFGWV